MRRLGWVLGLSWSGGIWAQDVEIPVVDEATAEDSAVERAEVEEIAEVEDEVESEVSVIRITSGGDLLIQGESVSKRKLGEAINSRLLESPDSPWAIEFESGASDKITGSAVGALFSVGIRDFETTEVAPPVPEPSEQGPGPVVVGGPVALMGVATPTGKLRMGLAADQLDALTGEDGDAVPSMAIELSRAVLGFDLDFSDAVQGRASVDFLSAAGASAVSYDTVDGDSVVVEHPVSSMGTAIQAHEIFLDLALMDDLGLRVGVQQSAFGSVRTVDAQDGFYTMGVNSASLPVLAGLVELQDLGVTLGAGLSDGQGMASIQLSNSAEDVLAGETDLNKAIVGRVDWSLSDAVVVSASGLNEKPGDDQDAAISALSLMVEAGSGEDLGVLAEFLVGSWDVDAGDSTTDTLMGGQVGVRGDRSLGEGPIDTLRVVTRGAYFDPRQETEDYDAWMLVNFSVQGLWASAAESRVSTGLGYEIEIPMDATQAIGHRAMLQAATEF
jgi:hypothetical protein